MVPLKTEAVPGPPGPAGAAGVSGWPMTCVSGRVGGDESLVPPVASKSAAHRTLADKTIKTDKLL